MAKLGLVGLGNLGRALGEQFSKASLVVFDRHAAKTLENAVTVASVADVVARSTTVVSCVPDDAAATAVADELLSAAKPGLLHVSVSTLSPVCATDLERKHREAGVGFVAAPVFARPENMRAGQASFALSGGDAALPESASFRPPRQRRDACLTQAIRARILQFRRLRSHGLSGHATSRRKPVALLPLAAVRRDAGRKLVHSHERRQNHNI